MASETRPSKLRVDDDGVRTIETPGVRVGVWLLAVAVGLVGLVLLIVVRPFFTGAERQIATAPPVAPPAVPANRAAAARPAAASAPVRKPMRLEPVQPVAEQARPARADAPGPGDSAPAAVPPDDAAGDATEGEGDEPSGIALFPPPGTDPPKSGILVPEDFELPPGYVRHYQVTDGGTRLPAILMFHPDFQLVDERGEPVAMPADRVVPPEMAPPGLAIHMLEVPEDPVPGAEAPDDRSAQDASP